MLQGYLSKNGRLLTMEQDGANLDDAVWLDLLDPTEDERAKVEAVLGTNTPTREEMEEIEISSRLYHEDGAAIMIANIPAQTDDDDPRMSPVTFILAGPRLATIRYHEPLAFQTFPARAQRVTIGGATGATVLIALLETVVDRLADVLERVSRDIDSVSRDVFAHRTEKPGKSRNYQQILEEIGWKGGLTAHIRDSLVSLERVFGFLSPIIPDQSEKGLRGRLKTLGRDVRSLTDHTTFLSQKINFLLDATLGMINIEQNAIIKIFSVAAVVFLPPTLVASIYGMNFIHMPELDWPFGYPFAIGLMAASAVLPYLYFKQRGWL